MSYQLKNIVCKFGLTTKQSTHPQFETQDTIVNIYNGPTYLAFFQIKGNNTSNLSNLKFEGTAKAAGAARLGKAPLPLVRKLSIGLGTLVNGESVPLFHDKKSTWQNQPQTLDQWAQKKGKYIKMFSDAQKRASSLGIGLDFGMASVKSSSNTMNPSTFEQNVAQVYRGSKSHIANNKLIQLSFVYNLLMLKDKDTINKYITDLLFIAEKKGNTIFPFGPFGKLY